MANPIIINPTLTLAGQAAAFSKHAQGLELVITHLTFGDAHYNPTGEEVALRNPISDIVTVAGGGRPTPYQLRLNCVWNVDVGMHPVGEIGYWADDVLVFIWSKADGSLAGYKTDGVPYVLFNDLGFAQVPAGSVNIVVDPTASVALAALAEHESSGNAHPQYLLRADVAKDSGQLAWLGVAGGTANALVLTLEAAESELTAYAPGQRFQFRAAQTNTDAVTANIEGIGDVPVMRGGDDGLVELDPGDIKADSLYDLNYDGTHFQLGGGVGSGKAFERFSFTAAVAQSEFTFAHAPGSLIALRNGREFYDFTSAPDGSKVTTTPMNINDRLEFLAFKSFKVADTYTKAELDALLATAGALPVGVMLTFPMGIVPPGYMEVNGDLFKDDIYPDLAAYLAKKFNLPGDAAGFTRLPESRGEFLRGWDHGRGVDVGRAIGSYQLDAIQNIVGTFAAKAVGNGENQKPTGAFAQRDGWGITGGSVDSAAPGVEQFKFDASLAVRASTETRGRNLAVMWCIKAWNAPVNQGNIDIAALMAEVQALRKVTLSGYKGLAVSATGTNSLLAIRARSLIVGSGVQARPLEGLDLTVNLAAVGLGGLDAGVVAPLNWYSIWVATNGEVNAGIAALMPVVPGTTTAGSAVVTAIASTALMKPGMQFAGANFPPGAFIKSVDSPTQITASIPATISGVGAALRFVYEPVLPVGYWAVRVGACPTDNSANKYPLSYQQFGRIARYRVAAGTNVASLPLMVSGAQGSASALVAISVLQFVPPTAVGIALQLIGETSSNSCAAPNASYTGGLGGANSPPLNSVGSTNTQRNTQGYFLLEEPRVYYFGQGTAGLMCYGWEDDL